MADMLVVATFKFSNPVLFVVKVKADNPFLHVPAKRQAPTSPIGAEGRRTTWRSIQRKQRDRLRVEPAFDQLCVAKVLPATRPTALSTNDCIRPQGGSSADFRSVPFPNVHFMSKFSGSLRRSVAG
jgi:hypothetical protein